MHFKLEHTDHYARAGQLDLPLHGTVKTPVFMPVGTQATVKTLDSMDLRALGVEMILSNAYHLYLRPGADLISKIGGLHTFSNWDGGIITDSGGFQVFSLSELRKIKENGVEFSSHLDGSKHLFTPESNMQLQHKLGADIIMALDVCVAYPSPVEEVQQSVELTTQWAKRCKAEHDALGGKQALFGIIQGGVHPELRKQSLQQLQELDLPGYAVGGLSVGEGPQLMNTVLDGLAPVLPTDKPRYLMGVGTPEDLWSAVERGIDMFDCAMPTRIARNGTLYTSEGRLVVKNAKYTNDFNPPDKACSCPLCTHYSRAYLRHLFNAKEITALRLSTLHNITFMLNLTRLMREAILKNRFLEAKQEFFEKYQSAN